MPCIQIYSNSQSSKARAQNNLYNGEYLVTSEDDIKPLENLF